MARFSYSADLPDAEKLRRYAVRLVGGLPEAAGLLTTTLAIAVYQAGLPVDVVCAQVQAGVAELERRGVQRPA